LPSLHSLRLAKLGHDAIHDCTIAVPKEMKERPRFTGWIPWSTIPLRLPK